VLHQQGGVRLRALENVRLRVRAGQCVALYGPSGAGKSTLLRTLYGNYRASAGRIGIRHRGDMVDVCLAHPWEILELRRETLAYVSQFLRVIPRVSAVDIVAEPLLVPRPDQVVPSPEEARERAEAMLERLRIPRRLWHLAPATFSGGEQQRVNIARGFIHPSPILLLDEPTASLDAANRELVMELIREAKDRGAAVVGIFHDDAVREAVADECLQMRAAGE
jgi:alpha-D-ribose 1-methylphosphonate 5-triphosphate synthase subunit PhnL